MNIFKTVLLCLVSITMVHSSLLAQQNVTPGETTVSLFIGWNFLGPSHDMTDLMIEYGFDQTTTGLLTGRSIRHPFTTKFAPSLGISIRKNFDFPGQLGIALHYAHLREVHGASQSHHLLFISFTNYAMVPHYIHHLGNSIDLKLGLPMMYNSTVKSSLSGTDFAYDEMQIGLLAGAIFDVFRTDNLAWRFELNGMISYNTKIGRFEIYDWVEEKLPPSEVNFSHLNAGIVLEF